MSDFKCQKCGSIGQRGKMGGRWANECVDCVNGLKKSIAEHNWEVFMEQTESAKADADIRIFGHETRSQQINELAVALSKTQADIRGVAKDASNPFFKSRYATLDAVWEALRGPLTKHGLSVVQTTGVDNGRFGLFTMLLHSSGQFIQGFYIVKPTKDDPQGVGSAITYARRYALSAITGLTPDEDDDGNAASGQKAQVSTPKTEPATKPPVANAISDPQAKRFYAKAKANHRDDSEIKEYLKKTFGIEHTRDITRDIYETACAWADSSGNAKVEIEEVPF